MLKKKKDDYFNKDIIRWFHRWEIGVEEPLPQ